MARDTSGRTQARPCLDTASSCRLYDADAAMDCVSGVGVVDGLLYAVGGHDGPLVRKSVEVFNAELDVWTQVADMHCSRRNAGMIPSISSSRSMTAGSDRDSFSRCRHIRRTVVCGWWR